MCVRKVPTVIGIPCDLNQKKVFFNRLLNKWVNILAD